MPSPATLEGGTTMRATSPKWQVESEEEAGFGGWVCRTKPSSGGSPWDPGTPSDTLFPSKSIQGENGTCLQASVRLRGGT